MADARSCTCDNCEHISEERKNQLRPYAESHFNYFKSHPDGNEPGVEDFSLNECLVVTEILSELVQSHVTQSPRSTASDHHLIQEFEQMSRKKKSKWKIHARLFKLIAPAGDEKIQYFLNDENFMNHKTYDLPERIRVKMRSVYNHVRGRFSPTENDLLTELIDKMSSKEAIILQASSILNRTHRSVRDRMKRIKRNASAQGTPDPCPTPEQASSVTTTTSTGYEIIAQRSTFGRSSPCQPTTHHFEEPQFLTESLPEPHNKTCRGKRKVSSDSPRSQKQKCGEHVFDAPLSLPRNTTQCEYHEHDYCTSGIEQDTQLGNVDGKFTEEGYFCSTKNVFNNIQRPDSEFSVDYTEPHALDELAQTLKLGNIFPSSESSSSFSMYRGHLDQDTSPTGTRFTRPMYQGPRKSTVPNSFPSSQVNLEPSVEPSPTPCDCTTDRVTPMRSLKGNDINTPPRPFLFNNTELQLSLEYWKDQFPLSAPEFGYMRWLQLSVPNSTEVQEEPGVKHGFKSMEDFTAGNQPTTPVRRRFSDLAIFDDEL